MKRKWIPALILIMCLTLLAGCGGVAGSDGQKDAAAGGQAASISETRSDSGSKDAEASTDRGETEGASSGTPAEAVDQYQTAAVPEGKPEPVEPQKTEMNKKKEYHGTLSIVCSTILDNMDRFDEAKLEVLPEDGVILAEKKVTFYEGESVFDVLQRETRNEKIHMEFVSTPIYNSNYIEGINNIYEFDCGGLSGWMYQVNGWFPNYGCSRYELQDGDAIAWIYTCDLGRDIGGDWASQNRPETDQSEGKDGNS